jgi:DNA-binding Lrp family transcriptional regulator
VSYWIYSSEALPNPEFLGKPRYTPDSEYIKFSGIALPFIPKGQWMKLPDEFTTIRRADWKDKHGTEVEVPIKRFMAIVNNPERGFAERGVIMLDHEPGEAEKKKLEQLSAELNFKFRGKQVEFYENQRQMALARQGTYEPTPYIDECYDIVGMKKPYSMEALKAQRDPGQAAAVQIASAIKEALQGARQDAADAASAALELATRPKEAAVPAARR